jgi:lysyl-tRNA synthetase class I
MPKIETAHNRVSAMSSFLYVTGLMEEHTPMSKIHLRASMAVACIDHLVQHLGLIGDDATEEAIQSVFYESGKLHFANDLRWWFGLLYQLIMDRSEGPRFGQFTRIMTIHWMICRLRERTENPWAQALTPP